MTDTYAPYPDEQALMGDDAPPMKSILDLVRYSITIHHRFGNTCVESVSFKWGATALWAKSDKDKEIERLRAALEKFANDTDDCLSPGMKAFARKVLEE